MQAIEHVGKKSILVDIETHARISRLRSGGQTFGDVVADSIRALEDERGAADIPCVDDFTNEEIDALFQEGLEHPERCISLEEHMRRRAERKGIKNV